ncbi:MAG: LamG domain-containing protein, partial [Anaerolineales bacterium]|nr:LamG domain-containing protein [Anaerolineales bacterium]
TGINKEVIWTQTSWLTDTITQGFQEIGTSGYFTSSASTGFRGLAKSTYGSCVIDGDGGTHNNWYNCVGVLATWGGGMPGPLGKMATSMYLYIWNPPEPGAPSVSGSHFYNIDNISGHTGEDGTTATFKVALDASPAPPEPAAYNLNNVHKKALDFNGSNGYVEVPHNSSLDLKNNFTIEAWVNVDDSSDNTILDKGNYNNLFATHSNGSPGLGYYDRNNNWTYSSGTIPTDTWVHVAVVFQTGTDNLKFYKDGALLSSHTVNSESPTDSGVMNIGRQSPSSCYCNYMGGSIDELRIWSVVRDQSEIQANMNKSLTGSESGLVAYYEMNDGSGTSLADSSRNSNTGTLKNMTNADWVDGNASCCGGSELFDITNISGHTAEDGTTATFKVALKNNSRFPSVPSTEAIGFCHSDPNNSSWYLAKTEDESGWSSGDSCYTSSGSVTPYGGQSCIGGSGITNCISACFTAGVNCNSSDFFTISAPSNSGHTREDGTTSTFNVALKSAPSSNVT